MRYIALDVVGKRSKASRMKIDEPKSLYSEMRVIGSLLNNEYIIEIFGELEEGDFSNVMYKEVFKVCRDIYSNLEVSQTGREISVYKVFKVVEKSYAVGKSDLMAKLMEISNIPVRDIPDFIKDLKEVSLRRKVIDVLLKSAEEVSKSSIDLETVKDRVDSIERKDRESMYENLGDCVDSHQEEVEEQVRDKAVGKSPYLSTGYKKLDECIGWLANGNLIILAARPGMGKTALALNIIHNIVCGNRRPEESGGEGSSVLFLSMEMTKGQILDRYLSIVSPVNLKNTVSRYLDEEDISYYGRIKEAIKNNLLISDQSGMHIDEVCRLSKLIKKKHDIKAIFIDYLGLMRATQGKDSTNRVLEVTRISGALKSLAKNLDMPVFCLSQLSRGIESRVNKKPVMSDLRDSGSIEQDADVVLMLYRRDYYVTEENNTTADVIVAKNRHGETGTLKFEFQKERCIFSE